MITLPIGLFILLLIIPLILGLLISAAIFISPGRTKYSRFDKEDWKKEMREMDKFLS